MKKIVFEFILIILIIFLLFKYNIDIKNNLETMLYQFFNNIIFSMFPIIFITTFIKYNVINKYKNKYIKFLSLIFSYAPSNSLLCIDNKEITYSSVINPLFSYNILINFFSLHKTIIIILVNMIINYVLLFKDIKISSYINNESKSITFIIKETTLSIINILGVIIFFNILISLLSIFIPRGFLFFIEITNGFKILSLLNNRLIKNTLFIFMNSFGGIAIYFQIKSINNDANYLIIFKKLIISIFITIISILLVT